MNNMITKEFSDEYIKTFNDYCGKQNINVDVDYYSFGFDLRFKDTNGNRGTCKFMYCNYTDKAVKEDYDFIKKELAK